MMVAERNGCRYAAGAGRDASEAAASGDMEARTP